MTLAKELALYGSDSDPDDFRDVLVDVYVNMCPALTVERLLYEPPIAVRFCKAIRARAGDGLPDEMILRHLQNVRKKGSAPKAKKRGKKS